MTADNDLTLEALLDLLDGVEAGVASAKHRIGARKMVTPHGEYNALPWAVKEGSSGRYEQAVRNASPLVVFDRLAAELKQHNGFWQHQGYKYWFHKDDPVVIDRRRV
jgi:hypothetical protein